MVVGSFPVSEFCNPAWVRGIADLLFFASVQSDMPRFTISKTYILHNGPSLRLVHSCNHSTSSLLCLLHPHSSRSTLPSLIRNQIARKHSKTDQAASPLFPSTSSRSVKSGILENAVDSLN